MLLLVDLACAALGHATGFGLLDADLATGCVVACMVDFRQVALDAALADDAGILEAGV